MLLTALLAGVIVISCSGRERENPLDPQNPETGGKPGPPLLVSMKDTVELRWQGLRDSQADYYRIFRQSGEDGIPTAAGTSVSPFFQDNGLPFGRITGYQISAVTRNGYESPLSDPAYITPGPHDYWVADYYGESVHRLSYDAMHVISPVYEFILPAAVVADTIHQKVWTIDRRGGVLLQINGDRVVRRISGFKQPRLLVLDRTFQRLWIVQDSLREIVLLDTAGNILRKAGGFGRINDLSWAGAGLGCWLADGDSNWVGLIDPSLTQTLKIPVNAPQCIDAAVPGGWAWTADSVCIFKVSLNGAQQPVADFSGMRVTAISTDIRDGSCWLALRTEDSRQIVRKLDFNGQMICEITGFGNIYDILTDPYDGGCLVADFERGQVVRISAEGTVISRFSQFTSPISLAIG